MVHPLGGSYPQAPSERDPQTKVTHAMTTLSPSEVKASRALAFALRHQLMSHESVRLVDSEDGRPLPDGTLLISEVVKKLGISTDTLRKIVEEDDKKRYKITGDRVMAVQGHSVPVWMPNPQLENPTVLFHGTKASVLNLILENGITPQGRTRVHLSTDKETALTVANRRKGASVILVIDAAQMASDGHELEIAENGVILGQMVPPQYIKHCIHVN